MRGDDDGGKLNIIHTHKHTSHIIAPQRRTFRSWVGWRFKMAYVRMDLVFYIISNVVVVQKKSLTMTTRAYALLLARCVHFVAINAWASWVSTVRWCGAPPSKQWSRCVCYLNLMWEWMRFSAPHPRCDDEDAVMLTIWRWSYGWWSKCDCFFFNLIGPIFSFCIFI